MAQKKKKVSEKFGQIKNSSYICRPKKGTKRRGGEETIGRRDEGAIGRRGDEEILERERMRGR
jgi:hypothetical protein